MGKDNRNQKAKNLRETELNDIRAVMALPQGRRLIQRVLVRSGKDTEQFTGNSLMFFKSGLRDMGIWLEAEVKEADIKNWFEMIKEAHYLELEEKIKRNNEIEREEEENG